LEGLECPAEKIHKIYSAWDMHAFTYVTHLRRSGEPTRVLSVARLVEKKGVEYVIRAVALARCHHPNLRYDVVGDGPLRPRLEALIAALGLEGVVTLHGAQPPAEVQRMMAKAHIFAHASVTTAEGDEEGQGVVLVEAQASGIPVIATQHGPFEEMVVDGVTGLLVPSADPAALREAIERLLGYLHSNSLRRPLVVLSPQPLHLKPY
jgi:colanic acid/amylovoran biosynthesis glycosyltransferase